MQRAVGKVHEGAVRCGEEEGSRRRLDGGRDRSGPTGMGRENAPVPPVAAPLRSPSAPAPRPGSPRSHVSLLHGPAACRWRREGTEDKCPTGPLSRTMTAGGGAGGAGPVVGGRASSDQRRRVFAGGQTGGGGQHPSPPGSSIEHGRRGVAMAPRERDELVHGARPNGRQEKRQGRPSTGDQTGSDLLGGSHIEQGPDVHGRQIAGGSGPPAFVSAPSDGAILRHPRP